MSGIQVNRLREFEAGQESGQDFCRPVRMQGAGWRSSQRTIRGPAWRRAMGERSVWRRALVMGGIAMVGLGVLGRGGWLAGGVAVFLASVFVQSWQFAEQRSAEETRWMN